MTRMTLNSHIKSHAILVKQLWPLLFVAFDLIQIAPFGNKNVETIIKSRSDSTLM